MAVPLPAGSFLAHRHTPEVTLVRYVTTALFLLGAFFALLGALLLPWFLRLGIGDARAGDCFLAFNAGLLLGIVSWRSRFLFRLATCRRAFAFSGALSALSLATIVILPGEWLLPSLCGLGLASGVLIRTLSQLSHTLLSPAGAASLLHLAGIALGAGSVAICILVLMSLDHLEFLLAGVAVLAATFGLLALQSRALRYIDSGGGPVDLDWKELVHPAAFLLGLALWFQAAGHWTVAGWLSLYLARHWGAPAVGAIGMLALYWFAHTAARMAGARLPPLGERVRPMFVASGAGLAGGAFLLRAADWSGVTAGTLLLGVSAGLLHTMTLSMFAKRYPVFHSEFVRVNMGIYFVGGLAAPWLIGPLADSFGIHVVIWSALGALAIVVLLLSVLLVETRLTSQTVAVE